MEEIYKAHPDKVKAIGKCIRDSSHLPVTGQTGVSNVSVPYMERLLKETTIVPAVNQIELHP